LPNSVSITRATSGSASTIISMRSSSMIIHSCGASAGPSFNHLAAGSS
jgi:hypothetical protein